MYRTSLNATRDKHDSGLWSKRTTRIVILPVLKGCSWSSILFLRQSANEAHHDTRLLLYSREIAAGHLTK